MHKDWTSNLAIINFIQMVDVLCAWSHDTDRRGIRYQCHKVKKMTALLHQCASWISVESVPVIHLQFRSHPHAFLLSSLRNPQGFALLLTNTW
jgi:hypothetical protein